MTISWADVRNPRWANAEGTAIDCEVVFSHLGRRMPDGVWEPEWVPFLATSYDVEAHGVALFIALSKGLWGEVAPYVPPPPQPKKTIREKLLERFSKEELAELKKMLKEPD